MFVKGLLRQSLNVESPQDLCNLTKTGAIEEDSSTKLKISSRDILHHRLAGPVVEEVTGWTPLFHPE